MRWFNVNTFSSRFQILFVAMVPNIAKTIKTIKITQDAISSSKSTSARLCNAMDKAKKTNLK